jgi:hypothetical protein
MDEKLVLRVQAGGALLICVAYFLPWASIMSPFGSIELRGLYVDYAWVLLILGIAHLLLQFALLKKDALGLPNSWCRYVDMIWRIVPLVILAFFAWYGANFGFNAHRASSGMRASLFGTSVESVVRAGLDYGYWIGGLGAAALVASVGLATKRLPRFLGYATTLVIVAVGAAFAVSRTGNHVQQSVINTVPVEGAASASVPGPANSAQAAFDSSPYVRLDSISAVELPKDYDADRYSNSIVISPVFKNVGTQTIVGLQGYLSVVDGFGNEVYGFRFRNDDKILPGKNSGPGGYSFEENQFEKDDPYHKMIPLIQAGTAKYKVRITQIALEDGTVLPKK